LALLLLVLFLPSLSKLRALGFLFPVYEWVLAAIG
jgi:hypothetical protein